MGRIEKIIIVVLGLISVSLLGFIIHTWTSQRSLVAAAPKPEVKAATVTPPLQKAVPPPPTVQAPQAAAPGSLEHVEGACMSSARALVPNGTKVNGMSVAYKHSLETSRTSPPKYREVSSLTDINFYTVTVEAEIEGRRFSSRYTCRQLGDAIQIMRP
jgi:hypothetical protein